MDETYNIDYYNTELCKMCNTRYVDLNSGRENEYMCSQCRQEYSKLKIPKWLIVAFGVAITVAIIMIVYSLRIFNTYKVNSDNRVMNEQIIEEANQYAEEGKLISALLSLQDYLTDSDVDVDIALCAFKIAMEAGYYDFAAGVYDNYFTDAVFFEDELNYIYESYDILNKYYATANAVTEVINEVIGDDGQNTVNFDTVEICDRVCSRLSELLSNSDYEPNYIYYYMGGYCTDIEQTKSYLEYATEYKPIAGYALADLARMERNDGDFTKALKWIEKAERFNLEDTYVSRSKATIYLAQGKYADALSIAEQLYKDNTDELYVRETYAIALYATGKTNKLVEALDEAKQAEYEFDDEFYSVINGQKTVYEYYVNVEE